jgi:hypothetical protein
MTDTTFFIDREELDRVFNPRAARLFEDMQRRVAETEETVSANIGETGVLTEAAFVTLSANAELPNEFVLSVGEGLRLEAAEGVARLYSDAPRLPSGHEVSFVTTGPAVLALPLAGTVATQGNAETLSNKTLEAPFLSELEDAADDAAAALAGVEVGQMYRNGSVLQVRVA